MDIWELFTSHLLSGVLVVAVFVLAFIWNRRYSWDRLPNGPLGFPIVGHLPFLARSAPLEAFSSWHKTYGDVYMIRLGSWNTVVLNGFHTISDAAKRKDDVFSSRPPFMTQDIFRKLNAGEESLAFSPFDSSYVKHHTLTASALRAFVKTRSNITQDLISEEAIELSSTIKNTCSTAKGPIDVADDIQFTIGSIIFKLLFGDKEIFESDITVNAILKYLNEFMRVVGVGSPVEVMPWLQYILHGKVTQFTQLIKSVVQIKDIHVTDHLKTFDGNHIRDVTDMMIDIHNKMETSESKTAEESDATCSKARLLGTLHELFSAGLDTSTTLLLWLIKYMAAYPDVQNKVQMEIDDVIGENSKVGYAHHAKLLYTTATFHEVMRISSVVPLALPHYTTKDTNISGYKIKRNTVVIFNLNSILNEKDYWGDPQTFRPERFLNDNGLDGIKINRVLPFGIGRRKCIGEDLARMQAFGVFATLMQRCSFLKVDGTDDFTPVAGLVYHPKPFRVVVNERM